MFSNPADSDAKTIYEAAAIQAGKDIPLKEAEIAEARKRLEELTEELAYLKSIAAFGAPRGHKSLTLVAFPPSTPAHNAAPEEREQKSAYVKLSELFLAHDKPMSIREIQQGYLALHGSALPNSTLYAALNKGLRKGTFATVGGGMWAAKR